MNHYMDFDPYLIRECNHQMHMEVNSLQLAERLREVYRKQTRAKGLHRTIKRMRRSSESNGP